MARVDAPLGNPPYNQTHAAKVITATWTATKTARLLKFFCLEGKITGNGRPQMV